MTEDRVGFLCNIASNFNTRNDTHKVLRSYYLMRCNELTKGYGLPPKYFSSKVRCPHCYSDWTRDSDVKLQPLKLTKRQRQKVKSQKPDYRQHNSEEQRSLLRNEMVQVCTFCRRSTKTALIKPEREYKSTPPKKQNITKAKVNNQINEEKRSRNKLKTSKKSTSKPDTTNNVVNVYRNAFDVFLLKNDKNTLSNTIKAPPKVIKNNKKRKDKFAGLCEKAVLASANLKEHKEKQAKQPSQNMLNLFLKPSMD